jgi:hypothetical protein
MVDAALDVADAWLAGGVAWAEMTHQQPPHPSMRRLLDSCATVDHRHHRGGRTGKGVAQSTDHGAATVEGMFPPPASVRVDPVR